MTTKFEVGDLVWAKLRYCTAWPAKVVNHPEGAIKNNYFYVFFYGSENYAWVKHTNIYPYATSYEVKRDFRNNSYRKAVQEIAEIFHEDQLKNGYGFFKTQKPKRTLKEQEERRRKIQERLKVRLFPKKGGKKKSKKNGIVKKKKKSTAIKAASGSSSFITTSDSPIPTTINVRHYKNFFCQLYVHLKRINTEIPFLMKDSDEPECDCEADQPPTLQPEL